MRAATVTATSPLTVRLSKTETEHPVAFSAVQASELSVGDALVVDVIDRRVFVLGKEDGVAGGGTPGDESIEFSMLGPEFWEALAFAEEKVRLAQAAIFDPDMISDEVINANHINVNSLAASEAVIFDLTAQNAVISGTLIANTLDAHGINADWINAGSITGSRVTGGIITGSRLRTDSSGARVEIYNGASSGIAEWYDGSGKVFEINGIALPNTAQLSGPNVELVAAGSLVLGAGTVITTTTSLMYLGSQTSGNRVYTRDLGDSRWSTIHSHPYASSSHGNANHSPNFSAEGHTHSGSDITSGHITVASGDRVRWSSRGDLRTVSGGTLRWVEPGSFSNYLQISAIIDDQASHERLKSDIRPISFKVTDEINALPIYEFQRTSERTTKSHVGFMISELPDHIRSEPPEDGSDSGYYVAEALGWLIKGLQEANEEIATLKTQLTGRV